MRNLITRTAVLVVAIAAPVLAAAQSSGRWVLTTTPGGQPQMELQWPDRSQWRRIVSETELQGLAAGGDVAFRIDQDAGRFDFRGAVGDGEGTGTFHFTPNRAFPATMRSLGVTEMPEVTDRDLMNLAWGGVSAQALREFRDLGYAPLTFCETMEMAVHQVSPGYVRTLRSLGVRETSEVRDAVQARMFGVTPEYVRELALVGVRGLSGKELVDLHRHGVTSAFVRQLREAGRRELSAETLREIRRTAREAARRGRRGR